MLLEIPDEHRKTVLEALISYKARLQADIARCDEIIKQLESVDVQPGPPPPTYHFRKWSKFKIGAAKLRLWAATVLKEKGSKMGVGDITAAIIENYPDETKDISKWDLRDKIGSLLRSNVASKYPIFTMEKERPKLGIYGLTEWDKKGETC
jgi:hypothetical protein